MEKTLPELKQLIILAETKKETLYLQSLPYAKDSLDPVMSQDTIEYHFGKLAKSYVDRFNKGEGDPEFNRAGAFLHNMLFAQFKSPGGANKPTEASLEFINKNFQDFTKFKEEFAKVAMSIQGSGWVYLSKSGKIKTIKNHQIYNDIVLLIDWWEHAWALDYQADKQQYLKNIWRIIDWSVISDRINSRT